MKNMEPNPTTENALNTYVLTNLMAKKIGLNSIVHDEWDAMSQIINTKKVVAITIGSGDFQFEYSGRLSKRKLKQLCRILSFYSANNGSHLNCFELRHSIYRDLTDLTELENDLRKAVGFLLGNYRLESLFVETNHFRFRTSEPISGREQEKLEKLLILISQSLRNIWVQTEGSLLEKISDKRVKEWILDVNSNYREHPLGNFTEFQKVRRGHSRSMNSFS